MQNYTSKTRTTRDDWIAVKNENPIARQMRTAQRQAEQTLRGDRRACFLGGPPGCGKSHVIEHTIREAGAQAIRARPRNARELVELFKKATKSTPIVLEECDHLFRSEGCLNILKQATERHGQSIQVYVGSRKPEERGYVTVRLTAPILVTLNSNLNDLSQWPKECRPHIEAMASRVPPLWIKSDVKAQWEYAVYLTVVNEMLRYTEGHAQRNPLDVQNAAIKFFSENLWRLTEVSPRRLVKIMNVMMIHHRAKYRWGREAMMEDLEQFLVQEAKNPSPPPNAPSVFVGHSVRAGSPQKASQPADMTTGGIPQNQLFDWTDNDLPDLSDQDLADLAHEALTELLRRNSLANLLSWEADKATITVQAAYGGTDFNMLRRGPDQSAAREEHLFGTSWDSNW